MTNKIKEEELLKLKVGDVYRIDGLSLRVIRVAENGNIYFDILLKGSNESTVVSVTKLLPLLGRQTLKNYLRDGNINEKLGLTYNPKKKQFLYREQEFETGKEITLADGSKAEIISADYENILVVNRKNKYNSYERVTVYQRGDHEIVTPMKNDLVVANDFRN